MPLTNTPSGLLILVHDPLEPVADDAIYSALASMYEDVPTHIHRIEPNYSSLSCSSLSPDQWASEIAAQDRFFDEVTRQHLEKHADCEVIYFGTAPIPLAMHLGYRLTAMRKVRIFLQDNRTGNWHPTNSTAGAPQTNGIPAETFQGAGDVVLRFGTETRINPEDTHAVVAQPVKEIEIQPEVLGRDIFGSHEQLQAYSQAFRSALDAVSSHLPRAHAVHLFAAIPVGLA
ncbi:MAG: SAVED domain-containing protein, partial [Bacteroidota bacterium]